MAEWWCVRVQLLWQSVTALVDRYSGYRKPGKPTALKGKVAHRKWYSSVPAGTAPQQSITGPCSRKGFPNANVRTLLQQGPLFPVRLLKHLMELGARE